MERRFDMTTPKTLRAVLMCMALFYCSGCESLEYSGRDKPTKWQVKLVRPDGITHKTWSVRSVREPKARPLWGGQMELYSDKGRGHYGDQFDSLGLIAPTGWTFDCQLSQ